MERVVDEVEEEEAVDAAFGVDVAEKAEVDAVETAEAAEVVETAEVAEVVETVEEAKVEETEEVVGKEVDLRHTCKMERWRNIRNTRKPFLRLYRNQNVCFDSYSRISRDNNHPRFLI